MTRDVEKAAQLYVPGYGSLSSFIAADEDHSVAVFKRFDKLSTRNLLYYQSELAELQARQGQFDLEDAHDVEGGDWRAIRSCASDWTEWKAAAKDSSPSSKRWQEQMQLAMEIRTTLKEYHEALRADADIRTFCAPSRQAMTAISRWFHHDELSELNGDSAALYPIQTPRAHDYISLARPHDNDLLTHLLKTYCSWLFKVRKRRDQGELLLLNHLVTPDMRVYSLRRVQLTSNVISVILVAALLFCPIYVLYKTSATKPKLTMGLIAMFTIVFASILSLVTNARRGEIFSATAAYAAVLVVFVSGNFAANSV